MMQSQRRLARDLAAAQAELARLRPRPRSSAEARDQRHFEKLAKKDPIAALLKKEGL